jgi:hypothetical protein
VERWSASFATRHDTIFVILSIQHLLPIRTSLDYDGVPVATMSARSHLRAVNIAVAF